MATRRSLLLFVAASFVLGAAQGAFAHDFWDNWPGKPWHRGDPGTTYQAWQFDVGLGPLYVNNPFGSPLITFYDAQYPDIVPGPDGTQIQTLHMGYIDYAGLPQPGSLVLFIPNGPVPNPVKWVYVQITSDAYTLNNQAPIVYPFPSSITSPGPVVQHPYGTWYTYNWLIEIKPNPIFERLTFTFPYSTNISQVVVDTICVVPEPSSAAALGVSGLFAGLVTLRRRRR
jgi:hypothetical protein